MLVVEFTINKVDITAITKPVNSCQIAIPLNKRPVCMRLMNGTISNVKAEHNN